MTKFSEWLQRNNVKSGWLARTAKLERATLFYLKTGKTARPHPRTIRRLIKVTRSMKEPITEDFFKNLVDIKD